MKKIIDHRLAQGWILEMETKEILSQRGFDIPKGICTKNLEEAFVFAEKTGYPLVAKVMSSKVVHKSDSGGVVVGIESNSELEKAFEKFNKFEGFEGVLVEETISGLELILGAKMDLQFGPVILLGIGGTAVEIYKDTSLRMAPLGKKDIDSMVKELKANRLLQGYRGAESVNMQELEKTILAFSDLTLELQDIMDSIDINPLFCNSLRCIAADARIILRANQKEDE